MIFALGLAPVAAVGTDLIVGSAPPEQSGAASGISETSAELGGALGIAVLGSVGRRDLPLAGGGGAARASASAAARDTAGGAVAEAEQLGAGSATRCSRPRTTRSPRPSRRPRSSVPALLAAAAVLAAVLLRDARVRPARAAPA